MVLSFLPEGRLQERQESGSRSDPCKLPQHVREFGFTVEGRLAFVREGMSCVRYT